MTIAGSPPLFEPDSLVLPQAVFKRNRYQVSLVSRQIAPRNPEYLAIFDLLSQNRIYFVLVPHPK
jgi:hypothetical protein